MIEERVTVVEKKGYFVLVESETGSACTACSVQSGCPTSTFGKLFIKPKQRLLVFDQLNLQVGEEAILGISARELLRLAFYAYLVPLLVMLVTAMSLDSRGYGDDAVMLFSILGLLGGLFCARWLGDRLVGGLGQVNILRRATSSNEFNHQPVGAALAANASRPGPLLQDFKPDFCG